MVDTPFFSLDGPLDSMPTELQMRCANLAGFAHIAQQHGRNPRDILEQHGIDPWLARDPDSYINCQSLVDLLQYCSTSFNDSLFGLHLAQLQEPEVYGCIAALCRSSARMREALERFVEFLPLVHSPTILLELVEGEEIAELRWGVRSDLGINDQANYQAALLNMKLLRQLGGLHFRPSYIQLAVNAQARDIPELEKVLGCRFEPTQHQNAIAFPRIFLERLVPSANGLVSKLLGGYLDKVKQSTRQTLPERVEDYVRGALQSHNCSVERCAKKLGLSVRTLQSQLHDSGLKFSDVVQGQRVELAKTYLRQEHLSLDDVAAQLGYSEQCSFGRAFKRVTGMTPKQYRVSCQLPVRFNS